MRKISSLPPGKLRQRLDPKTAARYERKMSGKKLSLPPQPRALQALELAMSIDGNEHNVYVSGEVGLGRKFLVETFLRERAEVLPAPSDWIYVHNFSDPDHPLSISLPQGAGRKFKSGMSDVVRTLRLEIPSLFQTESYLKKKDRLTRQLRDVREDLLTRLDRKARTKGFELDISDKGVLTLTPVVEDKTVSPEEFENLPLDLRRSITTRTEEILRPVEEFSRTLAQEEAEYTEKTRNLDRRMAKELIREHLAHLHAAYGDTPKCLDYLKKAAEDMLDHLDMFMPPAEKTEGQGEAASQEDFFVRYEVNLLVDNSDLQGAPVVVEDNPNFFNLLGSVQRQTEMGSQHTDFSLLKAGSVHRANGGFLILRADDILANASAWEGLLRCLNSGQCRLEDPADAQEHVPTRSIEPEPIPFKQRVVLIGNDELYETLLLQDERFGKFFKLKAHLQDWMERSAVSIRRYVALLQSIAFREQFLPFSADALALLVDYSTRMADDQKKLSLYLADLRDVMLESEALARTEGANTVTGSQINRAIRLRDYRSNLYEEEFLHDYDREVIQVPTKGKAVGRVNGLSVRYVGDYVLALPHQIACTVGVGHGGVIDLEREAELGGPIHTKGMMILKSYLIRLFAQDKPLVITGSLCFEQSYAHVDGDSAAGAELAALFSALSGVPVKLSLAFTGAVSQTGRILAVGEVTKKIEGFFEVCRRRGLTGDQGVIIPHDNVVNLMLKDEVVDAVEQGQFSIYPVQTIESAMELLTGKPAGRRLKNGGFSKGSVYDLADRRIREFTRLAERASHRQRSRP